MKGKRFFIFLLVGSFSCLLSGCRLIALPGQEPFGEQTYSKDQAQAIYEHVCEEMAEVDFSDWNGYTIEGNDSMANFDFYQTQEYTAAWYEGAEDYLWYKGRLYCMDGDSLSFREMEWEELQSNDYAARQWEFARSLLEQDAENINYKYIPMASDKPYLLSVEYPETEWNNQPKRFVTLSFQLDEHRNFSGFTLRWQEEEHKRIAVSYFPYEESSSLQAERKIWSFAHELGLIKKGVPSLSTQQDKREWCQSVIDGIDFCRVLNQANHRDELRFPVAAKN